MKKVLKNKFLWIIVLISILVILLAIYSGGEYRFSNFQFKKTGTIEVQLDKSNIFLFLDDERAGFSVEDNQTLEIKKIKPGKHTILAAKERSWPWTKELDIKEGEKVIIHPFVLPIVDLDIFVLDKKDKEYSEAKKLIELSQLSSIKKEDTSADKSTKIFLEDNKMIVENKNNPEDKFLVFESLDKPIKNISFYKDRNDVAIFASGNSIYAIETFKEGGQNFQPLFQGKDPYFVKKDFESLYVSDDGVIALVRL